MDPEIPVVDQDILHKACDEMRHYLQDMGKYESRSRSITVQGAALREAQPFIQRTFVIQPCAELSISHLKKAILQVATDHPEVNNTVQGRSLGRNRSGTRSHSPSCGEK